MPTIYGSDVYAYLARARRQLDLRCNETLFYAAFELRCGIESRLIQYLNARDDISKQKKKNGWRIGPSERELSKAFRDGHTVIELILTSPPTAGEARFFHTPVRPELAKAGHRLGDLLHCAKKSRDDDDPWWHTTRKDLEKTFAALELASKGTLLAPPMLKSDGRSFHVNAFYRTSNPLTVIFNPALALRRRTPTHIEIKYHSTLPPHAAPFLNHWYPDDQ